MAARATGRHDATIWGYTTPQSGATRRRNLRLHDTAIWGYTTPQSGTTQRRNLTRLAGTFLDTRDTEPDTDTG